MMSSSQWCTRCSLRALPSFVPLTPWHSVLRCAFPSRSIHHFLPSHLLSAAPLSSSSDFNRVPIHNRRGHLTHKLSRADSLDGVFTALDSYPLVPPDTVHLFTALHSILRITSAASSSPFHTSETYHAPLSSLFRFLSHPPQPLTPSQLSGLVWHLHRLHPYLPNSIRGSTPTHLLTVNVWESRWTAGVHDPPSPLGVEQAKDKPLPFHQLLSYLLTQLEKRLSQISDQYLPNVFTSLSRLAIYHRLHPNLVPLLSSVIPFLQRDIHLPSYRLPTLGFIASGLAHLHPFASAQENSTRPCTKHSQPLLPSLQLRRQLTLAIIQRLTSEPSLLSSPEAFAHSLCVSSAAAHLIPVLEAAIVVTSDVRHDELMEVTSRVVMSQLLQGGDARDMKELVRIMSCMSCMHYDHPVLWQCLIERMTLAVREGDLSPVDVASVLFSLTWLQRRWGAAGDELMRTIIHDLHTAKGRQWMATEMQEVELIPLMWGLSVVQLPPSLESFRSSLVFRLAQRLSRTRRKQTWRSPMLNTLAYLTTLTLPTSWLNLRPSLLRYLPKRYDAYVTSLHLHTRSIAARDCQAHLGPKYVHGLPWVGQMEGGGGGVVWGWDDGMVKWRGGVGGDRVTMFEWAEEWMRGKGVGVVRLGWVEAEGWTMKNRGLKRAALMRRLERVNKPQPSVTPSPQATSEQRVIQ